MTLNHFDPSELDRVDPDLERVAASLEAYASASALPGKVHGAVVKARAQRLRTISRWSHFRSNLT